jgi:hypothetical protein
VLKKEPAMTTPYARALFAASADRMLEG